MLYVPQVVMRDFLIVNIVSGKMHQLYFPTSTFQASKPLELVHFDVWGLALITSINDFQYYILFIDEYSKFTWL